MLCSIVAGYTLVWCNYFWRCVRYYWFCLVEDGRNIEYIIAAVSLQFASHPVLCEKLCNITNTWCLMKDGVKPKVLSVCTIVCCLYLHTYILPSICSSICSTCNAWSEGERSTLGSGWLGYSPRSREEWHHHILYCPAARHTWWCCPEWDSCSAGPNFWLTSVTCSQPHKFEAKHQICVESCSHNLCWNWSFFINWH